MADRRRCWRPSTRWPGSATWRWLGRATAAPPPAPPSLPCSTGVSASSPSLGGRDTTSRAVYRIPRTHQTDGQRETAGPLGLAMADPPRDDRLRRRRRHGRHGHRGGRRPTSRSSGASSSRPSTTSPPAPSRRSAIERSTSPSPWTRSSTRARTCCRDGTPPPEMPVSPHPSLVQHRSDRRSSVARRCLP